MDLDQTQAIFLEDFDDETDEEVDEDAKKPASYLKVLRQKGFPETKFPLYEGDNVIGRQQDACNIYIPIKALSKQHACIEIRGDSHLLHDKGSRNKTRRGKLFLTPEVRYEVKDGDEITLADVTCRYLHQIGEDVKADDSGSDTGSESMFQTAPNSEATLDDQEGIEEDGRRKFIESTMLVEGGDDEDSNLSNASSDLLQPTQLFGAALGKKARKGRLHEAATLRFAEDSDHSDIDDQSSRKRPHPQKNVTVAETPAATRPVHVEDTSTLVFPESDTEEECDGTEGVQTLIFDDDKKNDSSDKEFLLDAPTQAFVMESDAEDEDDDRKRGSSSNVLTAATQMYGAAVDDSCSEEASAEGPTLAYDVTIDDMDDDDNNQISNMAATQAYGMGPTDYVEPTMACDVDSKKVGKQKSRQNPDGSLSAKRSMGFETGVNGNEDNEAASPSKRERNPGGNVTKSSPRPEENSGADNPTQTFPLSDLPCGKETGGVGGTSESSTQVMDMEDDDDETEEEIADFLAAPTMACDLEDAPKTRGEQRQCDDSEQTGEESTQVHEDDATQVFETVAVGKMDPVIKGGKRDSAADDSTQTLGSDDDTPAGRRKKSPGRRSAVKSSKPKAVKADIEQDTVVCDVDVEPDTVVCDDEATVAISEDTGQKKVRGSRGRSRTQPADDETIALNDGSTVAVHPDDSPRKGRGGPGRNRAPHTSPEEAATQIFAEDVGIEEEEDLDGIEAETQMIGPTVALTEDEEEEIAEKDIDSLEAETQMLGAGPTIAVMEEEEEDADVREASLEEATQAYGDVKDIPIHVVTSPCQKGRRPSKVRSEEATQPYGDGEDLLDIAAAHGEESKAQKGRRSVRGRKQQLISKEDELPATQAYGMETTLPLRTSPTTAPKSKRGRKSKKTVDEFEATQAYGIEAEAEQTPPAEASSSKRGGKPKKAEEEMEATQAYGLEAETEHTSPTKTLGSRRGRKLKKAEEEMEATQAYGLEAETEHTSPIKTLESRSRRKSKKAEEEMEATQAYGHEGELKSPKSRRSQRKVEESEMEATQAYAEEDHEYIMSPPQPISAQTVEGGKSGRKSLLKSKQVEDGRVEPVDSDSTPLSPPDEIVPDSAESGEGTPSAIPLPRHSPHKSALASPERKKPISPKRVVFTGVKDSLESDPGKSDEKEETNPSKAKGGNCVSVPETSHGVRSRATRRSLLKGKDLATEAAGHSEPDTADTGKSEVAKSTTERLEDEEIQSNSAELFVPSTRKGKGGRGAKSKGKSTVAVENINTDQPTPPVSTRRGRGAKSVSGGVETPGEDVDSIQPTPAVPSRRGRGAKSVSSGVETPGEDVDSIQPTPAVPNRRGRGRKSVPSEVNEQLNSGSTTIETSKIKEKVEKVPDAETVEQSASNGQSKDVEAVKKTTTASTRKGRGVKPSRKSGISVEDTGEQNVEEAVPSNKKGPGSRRKSSVEDVLTEPIPVPTTTTRGRVARSKDRGTKTDSVEKDSVEPVQTTRKGRTTKSVDTSLDEEPSGATTGTRTGRGRTKPLDDSTSASQAGRGTQGRRSTTVAHVDETTSDTESISSVDSETSIGDTGRRRGRGRPRSMAVTKEEKSDMGPPPPQPAGRSRGNRKGTKAADVDESESPSGEAVPSTSDPQTTTIITKKGRGRKSIATPTLPDEGSGQIQTKKQKLEVIYPTASPTATRTPAKRKSEVLEPPSSSPSLRRKSMEAKPHIMFTGVVDEQGQKIAKDLGGSLADSVYDCTHLVTDKVRRTVKFLCCLSRGLPILMPQWLDCCRDAGTFMDPSPFLVKDSASEKQHKFSLQKSLEKASAMSLLSGYRIHVTKSVRPDPPQMKDIVQCAGAEYLGTLPKKHEEDTVVITCAEDRAACQAAITAGIPCVTSEFILTGILKQEIMIDNYRLFEEGKSGGKAGKRQGAGSATTTTTAAKKRRR